MEEEFRSERNYDNEDDRLVIEAPPGMDLYCGCGERESDNNTLRSYQL